MRTVSFSDPRVQNVFNQQFVNTFTNTYGDPTAGQSVGHRPNEPAGMCIRGNGKQNIQTIFMTPVGEIFHVATGYLSADDLLVESKFALELFDNLRKQEPDSRAQRVVESHRDRLLANNLKPRSGNEMSELFKAATQMNPGSGNRFRGSGSKNAGPGAGLFQSMINRQFQGDQQFSMDHPLITYQRLEQDPTTLVGNGNSFFASSSSGNSR